MPTETSIPTLVDEIVEKHKYEDFALIGVLQDVQNELRWLPKEALEHIAKRLDVPVSRVYAIATFYKAFSLKPRGKHICTVCLGTACHVRGGQRIAEKMERDLGIKAGETTSDMKVTLETVRCLGACALAPIMVCDGEYHRQMTSTKVEKLLRELRKDEEKKE